MNTLFIQIKKRSKIILLSCGAILFSFSLALLLFGDNDIHYDKTTLHHAKESVRADMLYVHPEGPGGGH